MRTQSLIPSAGGFARAALRASTLALLASVGLTTTVTAQVEIFGEWESAASVELYVASAPLGAPGNPGTRALPLPSITSALTAAAASGNLNVNPVTINVIGNGIFNQASGETFPIVLPAFGVSIEAHFLAGGIRPTVSAGGLGASEIFLINSVGNAGLPASVLRGLTVLNSFQNPNSADIRIAVPAGSDDLPRIAPEIRDCVISGEPRFGVQIFSTPDAITAPVLERNVITGIDPFFGEAGVDIVARAEEMDAVSALVRSNDIRLFQTNLRITGGGMSNQCRIQSNFIQVGETNVELDNCAPFLVNNTIAFAMSNSNPTATGISWANMPALGLSNNLIWNPDQGGVACADIVGPLAVFAGATAFDRFAFFNVDEDNTLFTATGAAVPNVVTIFDIVAAGGPNFVSGNGAMGTLIADLHLVSPSPCIDAGFLTGLVTATPGGVFSSPIPTALGTAEIRRDTIYDGDFGARLAGLEVEIGADEFIDVTTGGLSLTRGTLLVPTVGTTFGADMDELGNIVPDATGVWNSQVDIVGVPGDTGWLLACSGYNVTATSASGAMVENRSLMQNLLLVPGILPGVGTWANLGLEAGPSLQTFNLGVIPASGILRTNLTLGAPTAPLFETEIQLQGLAIDPTGQVAQATNRLTIEVNE